MKILVSFHMKHVFGKICRVQTLYNRKSGGKFHVKHAKQG